MWQQDSLTLSNYLTGAVVLGLVAAVLVALLARWIPRPRFERLGRPVALASVVLWGIFATSLVWLFWEPYYRHFFPAWGRWLAPLDGLLYAGLGYLFWRLARRLPGLPAVTFCLVGGLESIVEHLAAIQFGGILEKVPMMAGDDPLAVLAFAVPEYIFYWGVVLGAAGLGDAALRRRRLTADR